MRSIRIILGALILIVLSGSRFLSHAQELRSTDYIQALTTKEGASPPKCTYDQDRCHSIKPALQFLLGDLKLSVSGGRTNKSGFSNALVTALPAITTEEAWTYNVKFGYVNKPFLRTFLDWVGNDRKVDNHSARTPLDDLFLDALRLDLDISRGQTLKEVTGSITRKLDESTNYEAIVKYEIPFDRLWGDAQFGAKGEVREAPTSPRDYWTTKPEK